MGARESADAREVMEALRRIVRVLRIGARAAERSLGLSSAQLFVLQRLADAPAASVNALAERTLTHQSSVSVVLRRLIQAGLVEKRSSDLDRRRVELRLTPAGRSFLRRAPEPAQVRLLGAFGRLAPADRRALVRGLRSWAGAVDPQRASPPLFFEGRAARSPRSG